ncbi:hypothetical protein PAP_00725 [Palaeococcus pacificus DY20341]|uniref:Class III signal peptide-containing protein n=1 Tax=Palaeococcus pacificus DY20341 TaxID=1343739 RepID=A0A075LVX7_9EURY|nr:hypothetical protein [Palaeococcus pacificus]AIF68588.1 hypothetical protein PAP_00725 [Palaeococcus pacificus DY20341]
MRGQVSLDILFAILLITLTVVNLTYLATSEVGHAETFDTLASVKTLSITIRDHITKVYAVGEGFKKKEVLPFELDTGDSVRIQLDGTSNLIIINVTIEGKSYTITQNSTVPLTTSNVTLTSSKREFWIVANYNSTEEMLYVKVEP